MGEPRYKAYISYSHTDEKWAAWLQRALESYRVPDRLAAPGAERELPKRLSPVFRDREDLSPASSLSDSLLAALRASDALVVVCSPAAAGSRWVNEEIRRFRELGDADRIICMVVEGDPAAREGDQVCYPPALFEDGSADTEPLAADARDFADGKKLAKLKLVAALLGVRLDELRQRDLKRRRRRQVVGALALIAVAALSLGTVFSVVSERWERERAEELARFIVELGEELQSDVDLDTLGRISSRAMSYLDNLDPGNLTVDTSIRVGLALRQLGNVNLGQGKYEESLVAYQRSLGLFAELGDKHPDREDVKFELAQAEFYVGNFHYHRKEIGQAWEPWQRYLGISESLYGMDPSNPKWLLEVSYGTMNLLLLRVESGEPADQALLDASDEAVELARQSLEALPDDAEVISHYSNTLAWAADAELLACNLRASLAYRLETLEMAAEASRANPSNNSLRERLAYAHSGVATVQTDLGEVVEAERLRNTTLEILADLAARDPSNAFITSNVAANRRLLASLLMNTQRLEAAMSLMRQVEKHFEPLPDMGDLTEFELNDFADFILENADLAIRAGDTARARELLAHALEVTLHQLASATITRETIYRAALLRYLWFELHGQDPAGEQPALASEGPESASEYRSCLDAESSARLSIVGRDPAAARKQVEYLQSRQYRHPGFIRFCRRHELCAE